MQSNTDKAALHSTPKKKPLKFLIVRFSSIGDIVLTTPVIRCLKLQMEGCIIHFVTKGQYAPILYSNPFVDKVIEYNKDWDLLMRELKSNNYDFVIDLHHNARTMRLKKLWVCHPLPTINLILTSGC